MTSPSQPGTRSARELRAETLRLVTQLHHFGLLDPAPASIDEYVADPVRALHGAIRSLEFCPPSSEPPPMDLVVQAMALRAEWERHQDRARNRARDRLTASLSQLRSCKDQAELGDQICSAAVSALDVRWALIARIHDGMWSLWQQSEGPTTGRPDDPVCSSAVPLSELPTEAEVVCTGRALSSTSARSWNKVGTAPPPRVRVAPVHVAGEVVALLHLPDRGDADADDFDALVNIFTVGLGRIVERELLYERFRSQRLRVRATLVAMEGIMTSLDAGVDLVRLVGREHADTVPAVGLPLTGPTSAFDNALTPRERDVMALAALGRDNNAIATELAISTNTVKAHLRTIMRKTGAVNRTELITLHRRGSIRLTV